MKQELQDRYTIHEIDVDEIELIMDPLREIAAYHNRVAKTFAGIYPIFPLEEQLANFAEEMRHNHAKVEVLREDGKVVGFSKASFIGDTGEIDYIYIQENLRGTGLGKRLLDRMLFYLGENGVKFIELRVVNGNPARMFYEKYGFQVRSLLMARMN